MAGLRLGIWLSAILPVALIVVASLAEFSGLLEKSHWRPLWQSANGVLRQQPPARNEATKEPAAR